MRLEAAITLKGETLLAVAIRTAFDATGVEAGNHLRRAILDETSWEVHDPRFDQFLIATAAFDWASAAFRGGRDRVATVPCSQGRPCATVGFAPEHVRGLDPDEPVVSLRAICDAPGAERLLSTVRA